MKQKKKRQEEEANRFRESLQYETRLVAFLDVLGWTQAIAKSIDSVEITQRLGVTMQGMDSHVKMNAWQRLHGGTEGWPGDPMITHFSDSLLISFRADKHAKASLEMTLSSIIHQMLFNGFVVRGAVCYGPMIHRESLAYGPALITAYELERREALWPRVIVEPALGQAWGDGSSIADRDGAIIGHHLPWRRFEDNWCFFDYLGDPFRMLDSDQRDIQKSKCTFIPLWRNLIEKRLVEHSDNASIYSKYAWLGRYFNETFSRNCESDFRPLQMNHKFDQPPMV